MPEENVNPRDKDKKITEKMREQKIKARDLGVQNVVEFPSGAALLMIEESKAEAARMKIEEVGLKRKLPPSKQEQRSSRLHDVPADCTEEDIAEEVHKSLDVKLERVMLATYKERRRTSNYQ